MKTSLKNYPGFRLVTANDAKNRLAYIMISTDVHASTVTLNPATTLVYQDALLSGTKDKSREAFIDALKKIGATINVSFSNGICSLSVKAPATASRKALSLLFEALESPSFTAKEVSRISTIVKNNLVELQDDSAYTAHNNLKRSLFKAGDRRHPQKLSTLIDSVQTVTKKDLVLLNKYVQQNFWTVTTGGSKETSEYIEKTLAKQKKPALTTESQTTKLATPKRLILDSIPSRQNIDVSIGATTPLHLNHEDYPAVMLGLSILGFPGFASRLMTEVREKEGLTYGIYSRIEGLYVNENGYMRVLSFFAPDKVVIGLQSTFREIKKIIRKGVTDEEVAMFQNILKTKQLLHADSLGGFVAYTHQFNIQGFSPKDTQELADRVLNVSTKQINEALQKYLDPKKLTVSLAGPVKAVKKDIENFVKSV